ncbi:MAG: DNA adenine methylase [Anaerolineaceae bacterium]
MPNNYSPLRYPGGKTKLYQFVRRIIEVNSLLGETYIEPFAGGAGLALKLLFSNDVKRIVLNDYDPALYALWKSILEYPNELCEYIEHVIFTVEEWKHQRTIYFTDIKKDLIEYGFSALYLNRVNISGIINGGLIGGINQSGNYKMDARFNKKTLINRIKNISEKKSQIILMNIDAQKLLQSSTLNQYQKSFIYFDPPYVLKGTKLYKNSFSKSDHILLSENIRHNHGKWMVTYDISDFIKNLYEGYRGSIIDIHYSANIVREAKEYVFFSNNLILPSEIISNGKNIYHPSVQENPVFSEDN